jgi:transposase
LEAEQKVDILVMMESAKARGISVTRACALLGIGRRRVDRWHRKWKESGDLHNGRPGPRDPVNRLLPTEREEVLEMARRKEYVDLAHRVLTVTALDLDLFFLSFSSVYRILRSASLIIYAGDSTSSQWPFSSTGS